MVRHLLTAPGAMWLSDAGDSPPQGQLAPSQETGGDHREQIGRGGQAIETLKRGHAHRHPPASSF